MSKQPESNEIWVNKFNEESAQAFREKIMLAAEEGPNRVIQVNIDSYGGYVDSLAKMIETMNEVPNPIVTYASGKAMSCGAILLSHGDIRYCGEYSRVMIHNVLSVAGGDLKDLEESVDETKRLNQVFLGLLADNCGISYTELQKRIKDTTSSRDIWLSPQDAVKFGIVDCVGTPAINIHLYSEVATLPKKVRGEAAGITPNKKKPASKKKATKRTRK